MKYCQSNVKALNYNDLFAGKKNYNVNLHNDAKPFLPVVRRTVIVLQFLWQTYFLDSSAFRSSSPILTMLLATRRHPTIERFNGLNISAVSISTGSYTRRTRVQRRSSSFPSDFSPATVRAFFPSSQSRTSWPSYFFRGGLNGTVVRTKWKIKMATDTCVRGTGTS